MDELFLKLLNMSISASWLVLAVLMARFVLKDAPKSIRCILWALVGIRLVCPVSFESVLSLIPSRETVPPEIVYARQPAIDSGVAMIDRAVNPVITSSFAPSSELTSVNPIQIWLFLAEIVWAIGMAAMAVYALGSYLRLRRKVSASVNLRDNIWICDYIDTPFILGMIKPRIYLPSAMKPESIVHVLAHERAHLKRHDHWWKPLGFLLLMVHWFNPVMWVAYILLCRDIELACDERVIRDLGAGEKKAYSEALLSCSMPRHLIACCPLAFGEVGVKQRIKSVLHYKKPALCIIVAAVIICAVVAVCFLTDPVDPSAPQDDVAPTEEVQEERIPEEIDAQGAIDAARSVVSGGEGEPVAVFDDETELWEVVFFRYLHDSFPTAIVTVDASGNVVQTDAFGISLSAWEEGPTGMDILGSQYGGVIRGQLNSGSYYCLQQWNGMRWEDVPVAFEGEYAWTMEAWGIEPKGNFTWNVDWQWLYGELPPGEYRIGKDITDHVSPEDSFNVMFYVPFTLYVEEDWKMDFGEMDFSKVDQIRLENCAHGLKTIIEDPQKIADICRFLSDISGCDGANGKGYYGGDYALSLYAGDETVLDVVFMDDEFFAGEHPSGYPIYFQMEGADRDTILDFFAGYDQATADAVVQYLNVLVAKEPDLDTLIQEQSAPVQYLVAYGKHTLRYCYGEFLKGGQDDLRGKIMSMICKEILWDGAVDWDRPDLTGQQWFDSYRESVMDLHGKVTEAEMKELYPEQWLLYEMTLEG